jgi:hypothetical protein
LLLGVLAPQQTPAPAPNPGTYLGLLFAPNTAPTGVLVTQVLPGSPASKAGLTRNDLVQRYDDQPISGCEQLARIIQADKPGRAVKLHVLRDGKAAVYEATLALGPAICLAGEARPMDPTLVGPPATAKPAGPALSASVEPQADGRLKVEMRYYLEGTGRLRTRTLTGSLSELQEQVNQFPEAELRLAQVLLDRLQQLNPTPVRPRP